MPNLYLSVRYGLSQTVFPMGEKAGQPNFGCLSPRLLKQIPGLPPKVRNNLTLTTPAIPVPISFLAAALVRLEKNTPALCASAFPRADLPGTLKETGSFLLKHLKREEKYHGRQKNAIGVSFDLPPVFFDSDDPGTDYAIYLSFCPYFGLNIKVKLPLLSMQAIHTDQFELNGLTRPAGKV